MRVKVETNFNGNTIDVHTYYENLENEMGRSPIQTITRKIINLEEDAIKEALIKLGWTPPTTPPHPTY